MEIQLPSALGLKPSMFKNQVVSWGEPAYRGDQVNQWVFEKKICDVERMSNLSEGLRDKLKSSFDWNLPKINSKLESVDGSTKILFETKLGLIESVILRYEKRTSLCVSSQVGCKLACSFCQTGKLGFLRHLTPAEILAQYIVAEQIVRSESRRISHIVFMGMGEPLDNYNNVVESVNLLTGSSPDQGFGLSRRNVTISTSGIVPKIYQLAEDAKCALAVSLHAASDELRSELMPINNKWPLAELKKALLAYQKATGDIVTLEYILIQGKNVSRTHAKELVHFIHGLRTKVNLIPFNSHPGLPYQRPSDDEIRDFQKYLSERSIPAPVRYSKGLDVSAACGQLAAKVADTISEIPKRKSLVRSIDENLSGPLVTSLHQSKS